MKKFLCIAIIMMAMFFLQPPRMATADLIVSGSLTISGDGDFSSPTDVLDFWTLNIASTSSDITSWTWTHGSSSFGFQSGEVLLGPLTTINLPNHAFGGTATVQSFTVSGGLLPAGQVSRVNPDLYFNLGGGNGAAGNLPQNLNLGTLVLNSAAGSQTIVATAIQGTTLNFSSVPEPNSLALVGIAAMVGAVMRRRRPK